MTAAPVLSALRELLAKNIAARNQDMEAGLFPAVVNQILFSLTAARLLEAAGCARGPGLDDLVREQGLLKGLSSFFDASGNRYGDRRSGSPATPGNAPLFRFPDLDTDEKLVEKVITLTSGSGFTNEWKNFRSGAGSSMLSSFLGQQVRLSPENRMVVEDTSEIGCQTGLRLLQGTYIPGITRHVLDEDLSGKSPVSGGPRRIFDPCCGAGLSLSTALAFLFEWHLSWYGKHLVPLLREGKDPSSRSVQRIIPKPVQGIEKPGFNPLPLGSTGDGEFSLTWGEKARILHESVFGMDNDPQAVMVTRLLLLAQLLDDLNYPDLESFRPDIVIRIVSGNITHGNVLSTETGQGIQSSHGSTTRSGDRDISAVEHAFPGIVSEGGFDLVICHFPRLVMKNGKDNYDSLSATHRTRNRSDDPEPLFIESGLSVLKKGGIYCGTGTGRWLRASNASRFRAWLATFQLNRIITFGVPKGNKKAITAPVVTCITNAPVVSSFTVVIAGDVPDQDSGDFNSRFSREVDQRTLNQKPWLLFEVSPLRLRKLIRDHGTPLSQALLGEYFCPGPLDPGRLVISREDASLVMKKDSIVQSFLLPFIRSEEISPYIPVKTVQYLVVMPEGVTKKIAGNNDDPASWFSYYHTTFFNLIDGIAGSGDGVFPVKKGCWWEWKGPHPPQFLYGPVLLFSHGTDTSRPGWTIAPHGAYPGPGVVALPAHDLSLIGILNSNVFWLYVLSSGTGFGINRNGENGLSGFPLYIPDPECRDEMELYSTLSRLVRHRLALGSEAGNTVSEEEQSRILLEAGTCERTIDQYVYSLYGMSSEDAVVTRYLVSEYMQTLEDNGMYQLHNPKTPP